MLFFIFEGIVFHIKHQSGSKAEDVIRWTQLHPSIYMVFYGVYKFHCILSWLSTTHISLVYAVAISWKSMILYHGNLKLEKKSDCAIPERCEFHKVMYNFITKQEQDLKGPI
jgi:hypothetical protein